MTLAYKDWYEAYVEEGVRDIVRLLRDNGFNTISSCHHDMIIQCEFYAGVTDIQDLCNLIYNHLMGRKEPVTFEVNVKCNFEDSYWLPPATVEIHLRGSPVRPKEDRGVVTCE